MVRLIFPDGKTVEYANGDSWTNDGEEISIFDAEDNEIASVATNGTVPIIIDSGKGILS